MRAFKKYPNRRLYDIQQSRYVTVEDIRRIILGGETISVADSKTDRDLTRSVLLQILAEQEANGHGPILTDQVLEQIVRFHGAPTRRIMSKYIEQSIATFLDHQEQYRRRLPDVTGTEPLAAVRTALERNLEFWNRLTDSAPDGNRED